MDKVKRITRIFRRFIELVILPGCILFLSYDPKFFNGFLVSVDEGHHLGILNGILHGKVLYRDMYMMYGPLLAYIPAVLMKLFGPSLYIFRGFNHFGTILGLISAYFLARIVIKTRVFLVLFIWLLLVTKVNPFWSSRWGGMRTVLAYWALFSMIRYFRKKKWYWLYLAGLITGLSFLISQDIGICVIFSVFVSLAWLDLFKPSFRLREYIKDMFIFNMGLAISVLPFVIYAIYAGAFLPYLKTCFIDVPFKFPKVFVTKYPFLPIPRTLSLTQWAGFINSRTFYFYGAIFVYIISGVYLIVKTFKEKIRSDNFSILFLVTFGAFLLRLITREIYGMQFNWAAPPLLIIGVFLIEIIFLRGIAILRKNGIISFLKLEFLSIIAFLIIALSYINITTRPYNQITNIVRTYKWGEVVEFLAQWALTTPEQISAQRDNLWTRLTLERAKGILIPEEQGRILTAVVDYIKRNTFPDEPIFVFTHNGQYYFLCDRIGVTRFYCTISATMDPLYQKEIIDSLEANRLRYIIYVSDAYVFTDLEKIPNEVRLGDVFNYMKDNYLAEAKFGGTYILRRKGV